MRVEVQRLRMTLRFTNLEQIRTGNVQNPSVTNCCTVPLR